MNVVLLQGHVITRAVAVQVSNRLIGPEGEKRRLVDLLVGTLALLPSI
jgi:hypothetical protein